jgi:hypothetical protein
MGGGINVYSCTNRVGGKGRRVWSPLEHKYAKCNDIGRRGDGEGDNGLLVIRGGDKGRRVWSPFEQ